MTYEKEKIINHKIELLSREILKANAVKKIEYLSPEAIIISTELGRLAIKGQNLHVDNLDSKTGELLLKGYICSFYYLEKNTDNKWIKRIFR